MSFPVSRQGLEQFATLLVIGAVVFGLVAAWRWRRGSAWRRQATSSGTLVGLAAVALALGYTVAPNIPTPPVPLTARFATNPVPDSPEAIAAGRGTYQTKCAICHGQRGRGDGPAALTMVPRPVDLTVHVPQHAQGEIFYWISEGIGGTQMPAWKDELTETQRWELVRSLQALAAGSSAAAPLAPAATAGAKPGPVNAQGAGIVILVVILVLVGGIAIAVERRRA